MTTTLEERAVRPPWNAASRLRDTMAAASLSLSSPGVQTVDVTDACKEHLLSGDSLNGDLPGQPGSNPNDVLRKCFSSRQI